MTGWGSACATVAGACQAMRAALITHHAAIIAALLLLALPSADAAASAIDHEHRAWTQLLRKHVVLLDGGTASRVNYAGLGKDREALKSYREALSQVPDHEFKRWSKGQQLAFLINAYNAAAIAKILTRYPRIGSIWDFGRLFGNPFKDRFVRLLGGELSLDDIEHDWIRGEGRYNEPRIHFAVNCAAIGCPALREEAYVADRLDAQLEEQTRRFLSDRSRNRYDPASGRLEASRIFDWFKDDWSSGYRGFMGTSQPVRSREEFLANYAELLADAPEHRSLIRAQRAPLSFLDYDWGLNDVNP